MGRQEQQTQLGLGGMQLAGGLADAAGQTISSIMMGKTQEQIAKEQRKAAEHEADMMYKSDHEKTEAEKWKLRQILPWEEQQAQRTFHLQQGELKRVRTNDYNHSLFRQEDELRKNYVTQMLLDPHSNPKNLYDRKDIEKIKVDVDSNIDPRIPVSYTHLTLPTIYSV